MRGKGEYQKKMFEENCRAVYFAILENQPIFFKQLFRLLKEEGVVKSERTLTKCLRRLMKQGLIKREPAVLYLHHPNVLNPPVLEQKLVFGRFEGDKWLPDKNAPMKLHFIPVAEPKNPTAWKAKLKRLIRSKKKVYVTKIHTFVRSI